MQLLHDPIYINPLVIAEGVAPLHLTSGKESGSVARLFLCRRNRLNHSLCSLFVSQIIIAMATLSGGETILHPSVAKDPCAVIRLFKVINYNAATAASRTRSPSSVVEASVLPSRHRSPER